MINMLKQISAKGDLFTTILKYSVISFPIIIYFSFVQQWALNLPRADDFYAILDFLNNYKKAGIADKIVLLLSQHNEHRILSSRIVYVLYYSLFNTINFEHIIYLNGIILLQIYILVLYFFKKAAPQSFMVLAWITSICIFDLNNFENAIFPMSGVQNYGIILLFLAALYFYGLEGKRNIYIAVFFQMLAVFSSGNGNIASLFIVLSQLLISKNRNKQVISFVVFIVSAVLYYTNYKNTGYNSTSFTLELSKFVPYFLNIIGAHFAFRQGVYWGVALLVALVIFFPVDRPFKIKKEVVPLICITGFILCSMGIMAIFRGNLPIEFSYSSRYLIYPQLLVAITVAFAVIKFGNKQAQILVTCSLLLLYVYSINYPHGKMCFEAFSTNLKHDDYGYGDKEAAKKIADESCRLNIYCIENAKKEINK